MTPFLWYSLAIVAIGLGFVIFDYWLDYLDEKEEQESNKAAINKKLYYV